MMMLRLLLTIALGIAATAARAEPKYYYCWAPDPASGKVFMSETRPLGPVAERAGNAAKYSAWLKASGKVSGNIQAYCMMRETEEGVAQSRAALPVENCPACGSARNFVSAPMSGRTLQASKTPGISAQPVTMKPAAPSRSAGSASPPSAQKPAASNGAPWIIVLGNINLGRTVWSQGGADLEQRVNAMAQKIAPSGWVTLISARVAGAGAAMCVKDGNRIRFFTAFPRPTYKEAVREAQAEANIFAGSVREISFSCGAWVANDRSGTAKEKGLIDYIKDGLYEQVGKNCDESLPPIVVRNPGLRSGSENPRQDNRPVKGKACQVRKMGSIGVRG
jgi:hypothetical protein